MKMKKKAVWIFFLMLWLLSSPLVFGKREPISLTSGIQVDGFTSDANESGFQLIAPFEISTGHKNFNLSLLTGYVYSGADLEGDSSREMDALVDTKLNLSYELMNRFPFDLLFGLDFNIPTGKTGIDDKDLKIISDPDLFSVTTYGEGWDIAPHLSLSKQMNKVTAGIGLSYTFKGEYDFSKAIHQYNPGDIFIFAAQADYEISPRLTAGFSGEFAYFGNDTVDGDDFIQEGNYYLFNLGLQYIRANWDLSASTTAIYRDKRRIELNAGNFKKESRNSNGDEYIFDTTLSYYLKKGTALDGQFQLLYLTENDYDSAASFYMGERYKTSLGLGITQDILLNSSLHFNLKGFLMEDGKTWLHPDENRSYQGFSAMFFLTTQF